MGVPALAGVEVAHTPGLCSEVRIALPLSALPVAQAGVLVALWRLPHVRVLDVAADILPMADISRALGRRREHGVEVQVAEARRLRRLRRGQDAVERGARVRAWASTVSPPSARRALAAGLIAVTSTPYRVSTTTAPAAGLSGVCPRARAAVATTR